MVVQKEDVKLDSIAELLRNSEDDETFLDSLYDLYFFISITKGVDDIRNGRGVTLSELHEEMEAIYESTSRKIG